MHQVRQAGGQNLESSGACGNRCRRRPRGTWRTRRSSVVLGKSPRIEERGTSHLEAGENQEAAKAAAACGSEGFQIRHVEGRRLRLEEYFGIYSEASPVQLKGFLHYDTPAHVALLTAWVKRASDPDEEVVRWLKEGAPLGANSDISTCGIFPLQGQ